LCKHILFIIYQDAGVATNPYFAAILTGLIRQIGTFLGAVLLSRFPRKLLMVFSALAMAVSMLALGISKSSKF
jgi:hypothetical protein